jgi:DNA-binding response OmpR family regulator
LTKTKILIVEDERIIAMDIQDRLIRWGYDVPEIAASGKEAINKTERVHPHLVLMDIKLQGDMDGIETAKKIQAKYDIPILYVTAYAEEPTMKRVKETEPCGIILKPFGERELHTTIENVLNRLKLEAV